MAIVSCPTCAAQMSVQEKDLGKQVRCPKCSGTLLAQAPHNGIQEAKPLPAPPSIPAGVRSYRLETAMLALSLGAFGAHKFWLGKSTAGIVTAAASVTCFGFPFVWVIGVVEAINYLKLTDAEFLTTYQDGPRDWF